MEKTLREENHSIEELENYYADAKSALREMDGSKAILASEQLGRGYENQMDVLRKEKEALEAFQSQVVRLADKLEELGRAPENRQMAADLISEAADAAEKQVFVDNMKLLVQQARDALIGKNGVLDAELAQIRKECIEQNNIIELCSKNRADYSSAR